VEAFVNDASAGAYEKLIDHLLSLPQYGERLGTPLLDVVRLRKATAMNAMRKASRLALSAITWLGPGTRQALQPLRPRTIGGR